MASQVLSGTGDVTYTNNTGQNVRIVINYVRLIIDFFSELRYCMSWVVYRLLQTVYGGSIGRNIAGTSRSPLVVVGNVVIYGQIWIRVVLQSEGIPLELILAPTETFSVVGGK